MDYMKSPGYIAMTSALDSSRAARSLEFFDLSSGETSPLAAGDRVYFTSLEGDYAGTVVENWDSNSVNPTNVAVSLDCHPSNLIMLHRSLFRVFTALDHMSQI